MFRTLFRAQEWFVRNRGIKSRSYWSCVTCGFEVRPCVSGSRWEDGEAPQLGVTVRFAIAPTIVSRLAVAALSRKPDFRRSPSITIALICCLRELGSRYHRP